MDNSIKPWSSQSFLNLGKSMVIQGSSSQGSSSQGSSSQGSSSQGSSSQEGDENRTSEPVTEHTNFELSPMIPMKMNRDARLGVPMTLAESGPVDQTNTKPEVEQPKLEALSDNKVDVDIEPDVNSNHVSVNVCSFIISLSCCSKVDKQE